MVLAAGLGRRLAGATSLPKWLVPVNGSCPAEVHLGAFEAAGLERIHVVAHTNTRPLEEFLAPWERRLTIEIVINEHAEERNNWYSLLLGLGASRAAGAADVLVVNSDLFARSPWFEALAKALRSTEQPAALAVDPTRGLTEEAMKVSLDASAVTVTGIGKVGIERPGGEYVGLGWWSDDGASELSRTLEAYTEDPMSADNWYEHGIQRHLDSGGCYAAVPVPSGCWVEIDDEDDLAAARELGVDEEPPA